MKRFSPWILAGSIALTLAVAVQGHHSAAAYDTQTEIKVSGAVTKYEFKNPHVYMTIQAKRADGSTAAMEVEAGAPSVLNPLGFTKDSVKVGDVVTVVGNPARSNPNQTMLGRELYKADGAYFPLNLNSRSAYAAKEAAATSIAGTWFSPPAAFTGFIGGARNWPLTEKGKAASANVDPKATTQKDCIPIGAPALMFYPVATTITVQKERVVLKVDWLGSERVIHLDGRKHPPAAETSLQGHSVGHWDKDALVVETMNFKDHPMGLSTTLPSSAQKRLTERFSLSADRKNLIYTGTVEDPVFLTRAVDWSAKWEYRPNMPHSNEKCNLEVARKFLRN